MKFIVDFHIHSHYSIATSKNLIPEYLDLWAKYKGIDVVGTGDFTHPGWFNELREKLDPSEEEGLFKLKTSFKKSSLLKIPEPYNRETYFLLTAELSNIYKKNDKVRKVHNVLLAPDFETVEKIQKTLSRLNFNITSDGRPILGLDSRDLLEMVLEVSDQNVLIPAHIWTPWFSALGAKSGFNSIEECYRDLTQHIFAVETGLSSNPPMNWLCAFLDQYTLVSNSDAHSPEKLGREANIFNTTLSYPSIIRALKERNLNHFLGTIEFFPQEGKYHYDGHRKCQICWNPEETFSHHGICPVCNKPITIGVMNRVLQLSNRNNSNECKIKFPFHSLIPLKEILSEILGVGPNTKQVKRNYNMLLEKLGPEFNVLMDVNIDEIQRAGNELIAEGIKRMRSSKVYIKEGYDGEYGQIKVFNENELKEERYKNTLFNNSIIKTQKINYKPSPSNLYNTDGYQHIRVSQNDFKYIETKNSDQSLEKPIDHFPDRLDASQLKAVRHNKGPALIVAGPGTGKTRVLTCRIAHIIQHYSIHSKSILAITFTNKAAEEMSIRLSEMGIPNHGRPHCLISTFHNFGLNILKNHIKEIHRQENFTIIDEEDKKYIMHHILNIEKSKIKTLSKSISQIKQNNIVAENINDYYIRKEYTRYEEILKNFNCIDLDDLILYPIKLLQQYSHLSIKYRSQYQWILIDEYQDINLAQYQFIRLLAPNSDSNIFVIGDANQAIYGFRGANPQYISRFVEDYPKAKIYHLIQSYRCTSQIIRASNQVLIAGNQNNQKPVQGIQNGVKIHITQHQSERSEAEYVARTIEKMIGGLRFFSLDSDITEGHSSSEIQSLSDFAVLCRISRQIESIQKAFNDHSIPYQTITTKSLIQDETVKSIMNILQYIQNPENNYLKSKIIAKPFIDYDHIQSIQKQFSTYSLKQNISRLIEKNPNSALLLKKSSIQKFLEATELYGGDIDGFLKWITLGHDIDFYIAGTENVAILTLHSAKGLEFSSVFIIGCEDGLIPYNIHTEQESDLEEEKRLLYVGMTRAKKYLFLSYAKKRYLFAKEYNLARSPFLDTIENSLLEVQHAEQRKNITKQNNQLKLF